MKVRLARPRKEAASISLFPFMDVFLCIKGALILMFIIIAQSSGDPMIKAVYPTVHVPPDQLAEERAELQQRIERLQSSRDAAAQAIANQRGEFDRWENETRRLGERLADAKRAASELARSVVDDEALKALRAERSEVEARLDAARHAAPIEKGEPKYAIIPHTGSGGTHRRPIYIECRREAIILQPEGVVLGDADFLVQARDNPLASGLAAAREYLEQYAANERQQGGEPYPLLLVRPDGIAAYHVARLAIRGLNCEFGYELIDADWKLDCGSANPELAQIMSQAVESARGRQIRLALSAPSLLSSQQRDALRALTQSHGAGRGLPGSGFPGNGGLSGSASGGGSGVGGSSGAGSNPYISVGAGAGPGGGAAGGGGRYGSGTAGASSGGLGLGGGGVSGGNPMGTAGGFGSGAGGVTSHGSVGNTPLAGDNPYASAAAGYGAAGTGTGIGNGTGNSLAANGSPYGSAAGGSTLGSGMAGGGTGGADGFLGTGGSTTAGSSGPGSGIAGFGPSSGDGSGLGGGNPYASAGAGGAPGGGAVDGSGAAPFAGQASGSPGMSGNGAAAGGGSISDGIAAGQGVAGGTAATSGGGSGSPYAAGGGGSSGTGAGGGSSSGAGTSGGTAGASGGATGGSSSSALGSNGGQSGGAGGMPGIPNLNMNLGANPPSSSGAQAGGANDATGSSGTTGGRSYASRTRSASGSPNGKAGAGSTNPSAKGSGTQGDGSGGVDGKPGGGKERGASAPPPRGPVDITRPIVVECHADRLVLVGEDGTGRNNRVIALKGSAQQSMPEFYGDVRQRIDSWGLAGRDMQWKPVLTVQVAPDGAARYEELKPLLESSGIEVQRSAQAPASGNSPNRARHRIWRWFTRAQD